MKKASVLSVILLVLLVNVSAQSYSINKHNYDYRLYIPEPGDPYNPVVSGVCSFLVPGLGQMYSGEVGRGLAFLGGYTGCAIITIVGAEQILTNFGNYDYSGYGHAGFRNSGAGGGTMLVGLGGMVFVGIWSIVDAINVAKVNNMYIRSLRRTSALKLEMSPYVEQLSINNQTTTPVGVTLRVKF